jgi:endonuclease I
MLDMYTEKPIGSECEYVYGGGLQDDGTLGNNECERYNREHLVPQSVFGANNTPMFSDAHFVVPSDKFVNAQRGDLAFSKVNTAASHTTYSNGSKRGPNLNSGYSAGLTGNVFEPIDEFKGDIARMLLYFATRYEDQVANWSYTMFNGTSTQVFTNQALNVLLTWNQLDPVSQREIDRNNAIYARQNNRNPFIDNNSYVTQIWGLPLSNPTFEDLNLVSVYPNPTTDIINIQSDTAIDVIEIISINGQVLQQIKQPVLNDNIYTISNLSKGFYFVKLVNGNQSVTKKVIVN